MERLKKDVVILGAGLSGLYTALHIDENKSVAVISKRTMEKSNSFLAQGGIAASICPTDSYQSHLQDTCVAGAHVNDIKATTLLVKNAPDAIRQLIQLGVAFDTDEQGKLLATLEGGHSHRRVLHARGDATGRSVMEAVTAQAMAKKNITIFEEAMATRILTQTDGSFCGIIVRYNHRDICIQAPILVIATGGIGALYEDTTNQPCLTGDGIALALNAGCQLEHMHYIQFHPTAFYSRKCQQRFLISEAVRGESGILRNGKGEAFMSKYDIRKDLAPRDIVARSIDQEMQSAKTKHVWLDITHKDKAFLMRRFPSIYTFLADQGIFMEKDYIPVAPVAHYFVGGIKTDIHGQTNIKGIYACGEVASTGVHGANRLASNSLLECIVFAHQIANHMNTHIEATSVEKNIKYPSGQNKKKRYDGVINHKRIKENIQRLMSTYVGIIRTQSGLDKAYKKMYHLWCVLDNLNPVCQDDYEVRNMCQVGLAIIEDAIKQKSIGCHYKQDVDAEVFA